MKIKVSSIYRFLFLFSIFYMYTKALWDAYTGPLGKLLFYGSVFFGTVMFCIETVRRQKAQDVVILCGYIMYAVYVILNGMILSNKDQFAEGMLEYILYSVYFLSSCYYIRKIDLKETELIRFIYLGAGLSLLAVVEYVTRTGILPDSSYTIYHFQGGFSSYRARVFCVSPMTFCMMLGMLFLFAAYLYVVKKKREIVVPAILLFVGMLCTGSRGPLAATGCGTLAILWMNWRKQALTVRKIKYTIMAISAILAVLIVIYALGGLGNIRTGNELIDNVIRRFASTADFTNEWGNVARLEIWSENIEIFLSHFWTGIGISKTSATVAGNTLRVTESGVLKRLVETGIIGTLLYYGFIYAPIVRYSVKKKNAKREVNELKMLGVGILIAVGIEDIVLQLFADVMSMYVFWAFIALVYYQNNKKERMSI